MRYRRAQTPGATYFFTVVTYNRRPLFHDDETIALLRQAFHGVKTESPFTICKIASTSAGDSRQLRQVNRMNFGT